MDFSQSQKMQSRDFTKYTSLTKTTHSLPLNTCKDWYHWFRILYLSRGFDIWSVYVQTAEEYVKGVEQIINSHQFTKDQLLDIEFKKSRIFWDYLSIWQLSEGMKYHRKLMKITQENQNLFSICDCSNLLLWFCAKMPEELDINIPIIESMIDECLRECEDKEHSLVYLHFNLLKVFRAVKQREKIDETTWTASKLCNVCWIFRYLNI